MSSKPYITQEMKENIADDLALGYSYGDIADRYGVSYSTILRVKKSSEAAQASTETASEEQVDTIDTSIIPDTEENVKPESRLGELGKSDVQYTQIDDQYRAPDQPDFEAQREYITDILKATLEDIEEELQGFEERIRTLQERCEECRRKQAYLRDFIRSM